MKKLFNGLALLCLLFYSNGIISQTVTNQEKYWAYRDRLRKNFVRIGTEQGQSIPAGARSIGFAFWFLNPNVSSVYLFEPVEMGNRQPFQNLWFLFHFPDKGETI
jgi:hypothetical protein